MPEEEILTAEEQDLLNAANETLDSEVYSVNVDNVDNFKKAGIVTGTILVAGGIGYAVGKLVEKVIIPQSKKLIAKIKDKNAENKAKRQAKKAEKQSKKAEKVEGK